MQPYLIFVSSGSIRHECKICQPSVKKSELTKKIHSVCNFTLSEYYNVNLCFSCLEGVRERERQKFPILCQESYDIFTLGKLNFSFYSLKLNHNLTGPCLITEREWIGYLIMWTRSTRRLTCEVFNFGKVLNWENCLRLRNFYFSW